jgi:hypothetical protein
MGNSHVILDCYGRGEVFLTFHGVSKFLKSDPFLGQMTMNLPSKWPF